jgi:hypothetical protein
MAKEFDDEGEARSERLELRLSPSLIRAIDDWRRREPDLPVRSEAVRRMLWLAAKVKNRPGK